MGVVVALVVNDGGASGSCGGVVAIPTIDAAPNAVAEAVDKRDNRNVARRTALPISVKVGGHEGVKHLVAIRTQTIVRAQVRAMVKAGADMEVAMSYPRH